VLRSAARLLYHLAVDGSDRWYPLLAVYYLTYRCSFRCPYCSDGAGAPYYRLRERVLDAEGVLALLRIVRRHSDFLVVTGGEPLEHPEVDRVLRGLPDLGFEGLVLTTNGHRLGPRLPLPRGAVTELVFSLDTLDEARADACFGVGPGAFRTILETIDRAARAPGRDYEVVISTVVTPEGLGGLDALYDWSRARGFTFAACPQLVGVKAHPALAGDPRYRAFYDRLIDEKRAGQHVHGTVPYLAAMRDLRHFRCRPFTMLCVAPEGRVFYPCLELGQLAESLLDEPDLHAIRRRAAARFGPQPRCDTRCHSACALGFSLLLEDPTQLAAEAWQQARGRLRRLRRAR
jgi:MoaA/NifB/PqqE/SkfB family radical SAM enzyme